MNNIIFARLFILYLLFNIGGWIYFGYLQYYLNFINSDNCNYYYYELIANKILIGIIMSLVTLNTLTIISIYKNNEFGNININLYFDTFIYRSFLILLFLTISGIIGLVIFIKSNALTNIYCSDNNAFFGIQLSIYGTIWIAIIELICITFIILSILCNIIKDSKLYLLFLPCYDIYNKYKQRRIEIENHNNEISIPITALKENNKILCCICYDSSISLLLEPCNHICICELCYNSLVSNNCPICKKEILSKKKVYLINY